MDKTTVISEVALRTERNVADIRDTELNAALLALTMALPALKKECYTTTSAGVAEYALSSFPDRLRHLDSAVITSATNRNENVGLRRMSDFQKYKAILADEQTADYDTPTQYIVDGDTLYLFPTPDTTYTLTLCFSAIENDIDNIDSNAVYFEPLVDRGCYEVYKNRGQARSEGAIGHLQSFQDWVRNFTKTISGNQCTGQVIYSDI